MIIMSKYEAWPISWVGTLFLSQTRLFLPWASSPSLKKSSGKCVCLKIGYHCLSQFKFMTVAMNMGTLCCEAQKRRVGSALPGGRLLEAGDECHWLKSQQGNGRGRHRFYLSHGFGETNGYNMLELWDSIPHKLRYDVYVYIILYIYILFQTLVS